MYVKLMVRGLARHQKRGKRLFVLLALCSAALVFLLTFAQEFGAQYRDLFIGLQTGHLQVLPADSSAFAVNPWVHREEETPMMTVTPEFDGFVRSLPEVEEAAPVLDRYGVAYNLDSEQESWVSLVAVPADRFARLFPMARVIEGPGGLAWKPGQPEVAFLHARLQTEFGENNPDPDHFALVDLLDKPAALDPFKAELKRDFPTVFGASDYSGQNRNAVFFDDWNRALPNPELYRLIPPARLEPYDWKIDDALAAVRDNTEPSRTPFLNRRLFQALYPRHVAAVRDPIVPGKSVTLQVPKFKSAGALDLPAIVPVRYSGMVDIMPLYTPNSFLDLAAFRHYLGVPDDKATAYVVRLKDARTAPQVKARLEGWLKDHGSTDRVADAAFLGKLFMATATAFDAVILLLVGVFVIITVIFIVNLVLMSLIQRRREIGTGLALGLTNTDTIVLLLGEVGAIVTVSWLAGCLLGTGLVAVAHAWGVPGMVFFPGGRLFLNHHFEVWLLTWAVLFPVSLVAALVPLSGLRKLLPVDLFKEAR
jgi:hypothetical protein